MVIQLFMSPFPSSPLCKKIKNLNENVLIFHTYTAVLNRFGFRTSIQCSTVYGHAVVSCIFDVVDYLCKMFCPLWIIVCACVCLSVLCVCVWCVVCERECVCVCCACVRESVCVCVCGVCVW